MKEGVKVSDDVQMRMVVVNRYGGKEYLPDGLIDQCPVAVFLKNTIEESDDMHEAFCYPVFDGHAHNNLYGRLMTLVEAIIEDKGRQKAVKDIVSREISDFGRELARSATEIANGGDSSANIYKR
jgi:hypothetical protein